MKINDIAAVVKKEKIIDFFESGGNQWVKAGRVIYPLYGMPELNEDTLPVALSIPAQELPKHIIRHTAAPEEYDFSDYCSDEQLLPMSELVSIGYGGEVLYPARTTAGLKFYDPRYLRPLKESYDLCQRRREDGSIYLSIKCGLVLTAIIEPVLLDDRDMAKRLRQLVNELENNWLSSPEGKLRVNPETGEILGG